MLKIATLIATLVATGAFATHAEAGGMGTFYSSPFFRNQGRKPAEPSPSVKAEQNRLEALNRARERRAAEIRAERAAAQAAAAAAAKRARLAAAIEQKKAASKAASLVAPQQTSTENPAAPKGDLLQLATQSPAPTSEAAKEKTADAVTADVCRKYSPTTAGLVEVPCR